MIHKVMLKMIDYNYGCPELVNHALKVYGFAKIIGEEEHLPEKKTNDIRNGFCFA